MKRVQIRNVGRVLAVGVRHPWLFRLLVTVRRQHLTYLGYGALLDLAERVSEVEKQGLPGVFVEAGTALGGSAIWLTAVKPPTRPLYLYDTFGLIPPPSTKDGVDVHKRYEDIEQGKAEGLGGQPYYGYQENLLDKVKGSFIQYQLPPETHHVHFVQGLYQESLHITQPVALAHIDCDWYESVLVCLERIVPHLVVGGVLVIDDYFSWSGCRTAVDEFFANRQHQFTFTSKARLHIIRSA
jgi:hypothetical protein